MEIIDADVQENDFRTNAEQTPNTGEHQPNTSRTLPNTTEHYTAQMIADRYPDLEVKADAVRIRWFDWIKKVAPESLLKTGKGYTQLAAELFDDYVQAVKIRNAKPHQWVEDAKTRYQHEWESAGIIQGELVPEELKIVLAGTQSSSLARIEGTELEEAELSELMEYLETARSTLTDREVEKALQEGEAIAVKKFKVRQVAEVRKTSELQKKFGLL
jgi:hypothetical protein